MPQADAGTRDPVQAFLLCTRLPAQMDRRGGTRRGNTGSMFGLHFHPRSSLSRPRRLAEALVVAREVSVAPSGWIFFDGRETRVRGEDGTQFTVPGGAFFVPEARFFADPQEAGEVAARLNDADPCLDRPWQVLAAAGFLRPGRVPGGRARPKGGM